MEHGPHIPTIKYHRLSLAKQCSVCCPKSIVHALPQTFYTFENENAKLVIAV